MPFKLTENDKFALIAVHSVYTDLPNDFEYTLSDGTIVLTKVPLELGNTWEEWIGSIRSEKLKAANLILIRSMQSATAGILDGENSTLSKHVAQLFYMLQLSGVIEYEEAYSLTGAFYEATAHVRQHGLVAQFVPSKGYIRTPATVDRLEMAARARGTLQGIYESADFSRLGRGINILMESLKQKIGQDKLHQAVRSLEALRFGSRMSITYEPTSTPWQPPRSAKRS